MNIITRMYVSQRPASASVFGGLRARTISSVCALLGAKKDSVGGTNLPSCRELSWSAVV